MVRYTIVATCALAQWALDFTGNYKRICQSIREAKSRGAKFRTGPELEISGYGCEDHFYEEDTISHSWESMRELLRTDLTDNILCDIGMPVVHENVRYNCRVYVLNRKILMIRPKMALADEGNYRESRWFTAWNRGFSFQEFLLPRLIREVTGQQKVKFGVGALCLADTMIGSETCEELFTPDNPAIYLGLGGVEILANGSGSHHGLGKLKRRLELMCETTKKNGGLYLYSNHQGCDGSRMYFDGAAIIVMNGNVLAQGTQFSMKDVEVVTASVDLTEVHNYRTCIASRGVQAAKSTSIPKVDADWYLCDEMENALAALEVEKPLKLSEPEEEIAFGPACWLWDYLRRSGMRGFFLPLSGGNDSAAVAAIVHIMCQCLLQVIVEGQASTLSQLRKLTHDPKFQPTTSQDIAKKIFHTCFMSTECNTASSKQRASALAKEIGSNHLEVDITPMVEGTLKVWEQIGKLPDGQKETQEGRAVQNLQARSRMVFSYVCGQLLPCAENPNDENPGNLLILGTSNLDDALRGFFTKYDTSSADINPVGALSKVMLRRFLTWAGEHRGIPTLMEIAGCKPCSELQLITPAVNGAPAQFPSSEDQMGMTFEELDYFGQLRMIDRCGPLSMFRKLLRKWESKYSMEEIAKKVKTFFRFYALNRHKMTTLTPSYHLENYSPDDNRYDLRQFLYDPTWSWQFQQIDKAVAQFLVRKRDRDEFEEFLAPGRTSVSSPKSLI